MLPENEGLRWTAAAGRKDIMALLGHVDEVVPELGVGDLRQFHDALINTFALKLGDPVFGDDKVDVTAGCGNTGALAEMGYNAGHLAVLGRGRQGNDRKPAFGHGTAPQEIDLVPDAAVKQVAGGVRTHLPGQIDFERRTDGNEVVVSGNDRGIVDEFRGAEIENRVVVHIPVKLFGAHAQRSHHPSRQECFFLVGDDPFFQQGDKAVGNQLGVDPQIFLSSRCPRMA